jgi:phosphate transport system permease protein
MTATVTPLRVSDLQASPRRKRRNRVVRSVFFVMALLSVVISALIIISLVGEAWTFISQVEIATLWTDQWNPRQDSFDLRTIMIGTLIVTIVAMVIAIPIGLGAAIYLSEYARPKSRRVLKPILEILAGIPSVVLGFFALSFISPEIVQRLFSEANLLNMTAAGIGVGILVIPLVASVSEDAMRSVPQALREGAYGMGARKMTVSTKVVVPAAISGLVAAFILAISRAIGETMVVLIAAGSGGSAKFTANPLDPGLTMTAAMATQARGTDAVRGSGLAFPSLFFVGLLLFILTLGLNLIAGRVVKRVRQVY